MNSAEHAGMAERLVDELTGRFLLPDPLAENGPTLALAQVHATLAVAEALREQTAAAERRADDPFAATSPDRARYEATRGVLRGVSFEDEPKPVSRPIDPIDEETSRG